MHSRLDTRVVPPKPNLSGPGLPVPALLRSGGPLHARVTTTPMTVTTTATASLSSSASPGPSRTRRGRAMADLDNSHKRHTRDLEHARADERARVAKQFLPLVDHLELALGHADTEPSVIVEGVKHVLAEAIEVLRRLGFPRIDQVGERFDPARHEAVSAIDVDDAEPGTVVHVVRPGYGEGSGQLRPASVVVSTGRQ